MDLNTFRNVNEVLKLVMNDKGTSEVVKVDLEGATTFFANIIADIDKQLEKDSVKNDVKKGRLLIYPLRIQI